MPQALTMHPEHSIKELGEYFKQAQIVNKSYLEHFLKYNNKIRFDNIQNLKYQKIT